MSVRGGGEQDEKHNTFTHTNVYADHPFLSVFFSKQDYIHGFLTIILDIRWLIISSILAFHQ